MTTYQAGKLVLVRDEGDHLNTHFCGFQAPMGMALSADRLAVGTHIQVWEFVTVPAVTAKLDPPGRLGTRPFPRRKTQAHCGPPIRPTSPRCCGSSARRSW